jgi:glycosyltransferase involved in cell wall biosynthesis
MYNLLYGTFYPQAGIPNLPRTLRRAGGPTVNKDRVDVLTGPLLHLTDTQFTHTERFCRGLKDSFEFTVTAPVLGTSVRRRFAELGIPTRALYGSFSVDRFRDEAAFFAGSWILEATLGSNRWLAERALRERDSIRLSFCLSMACEADIWWAQGLPIVPTLANLEGSLSPQLRLLASLGSPMLSFFDRRYTRRKVASARRIYANSEYIADWYSRSGVPIEGIMRSFGAGDQFYPTTRTPSRDYILSYLGKETDMDALRRLIDTGHPIRIFGSKSQNWVRGAFARTLPPHVRILGRVSMDELRSLYSNAAFTAFPFTEEPFGMVPIESMACGTPVLTYGVQGPGMTVLDRRTGWLVRSPEALARQADLLFQGGGFSGLDSVCIARAREFAPEHVLRRWAVVLHDAAVELTNAKRTTGHSRLPRGVAGPGPGAFHVMNAERDPLSTMPTELPLTAPNLDPAPALTSGPEDGGVVGPSTATEPGGSMGAAPILGRSGALPVGVAARSLRAPRGTIPGSVVSRDTRPSEPTRSPPSVVSVQQLSSELIEISFRMNDAAWSRIQQRGGGTWRPPQGGGRVL